MHREITPEEGAHSPNWPKGVIIIIISVLSASCANVYNVCVCVMYSPHADEDEDMDDLKELQRLNLKKQVRACIVQQTETRMK
jgi:hypothetical protein